jgi:hypothetical protein
MLNLSERILTALSVSRRQDPVTCSRNVFDQKILPIPATKKQTGKLVIGYIGAIGWWFDWDSVIALARAVPWGEVRLIGPYLERPPRHLPANINCLPACRHEEVGNLLKEFSVGVIPFRKAPLKEGVDPIKYYECRAIGLPVLSTTFGEIKRLKGEPGVFFMDGWERIETVIQSSVSYKPDPEELVRENSWHARFSACGLFSSLFTGC